MKQVLCFGDSNTWGYNGATKGRYAWEDRWTGILQDRLADRKVHIIEEGLVVVQHFGGLGKRHGVHFAVAELEAFVVVAFNEVGLLLRRQAQDFGGAVGTGHFSGTVDVSVQGLHGLGQVVQGHVVRIAVGDVGLGAHGNFGGHLVAHVVIAANGGVFHVDVGIQFVEFSDIGVQHGGQVGAHGVVEGDGNIAAVIGGSGFSAGEAAHAQQHGQKQEQGDDLFHLDFPSFLLVE